MRTVLFFFSSRRRHTRLTCDWSSDVCSNEVILRSAIAAGVPVIDLRLVCTEEGDYSPLSPIEPSVVGGAKIAGAIVRAVTGHDFAARRCSVWVRVRAGFGLVSRVFVRSY